jgi:hypothetical protein
LLRRLDVDDVHLRAAEGVARELGSVIDGNFFSLS